MAPTPSAPLSIGLRRALGLERRRIGRPDVSGRGDAGPIARWWRDQTPAARKIVVRTPFMLAAVGLGFWGFQEMCGRPGTERCDPASGAVIYQSLMRTLQLLTTQFPPNLPADQPLQLQLARLILPVFAFWFTLEAVLAQVGRPIRYFALARWRGHVVVAGRNERALLACEALRASGRRVAAILPRDDDAAAEPFERLGVHVVRGDPAQYRTLRSARLPTAAALLVFLKDDGAAVATAAAAAAITRQFRDGDGDLQLLLSLDRAELRALATSQLMRSARDSRVDLKIHRREANVARALLARFPLDWGSAPGAADVGAVLVGLGDMGGEILRQAIRTAAPTPGRKPRFAVVDRAASAALERLRLECPELERCCELSAIDADVDAGRIGDADIERWFGAPTASAVYVCCGDDESTMAMAIGLRKAFARRRTASPPLFVYQRRGRELVDSLPHLGGAGFDASRIVPFGDARDGMDPYQLLNEEIDALARARHAEHRRLAAADPAAGRSTTSQVAWSSLEETYRAATRGQADHVLPKLRTLGWHASTTAPSAPPVLDGPRTEALAEIEHERWRRERALDGWRRGEPRDNERKIHPFLVDYAGLPEATKRSDRIAVEDLMRIPTTPPIHVRADLRVGVWIHGDGDAGSRALGKAAIEALATIRTDNPDRHLQIVLPLRSPIELAIGEEALAGDDEPRGFDVASVFRDGIADSAPTSGADRERAARLTYAADRAFVVTPADGPQPFEARALSTFAAACDIVVVCADSGEAADVLLRAAPSFGASIVKALPRAASPD